MYYNANIADVLLNETKLLANRSLGVLPGRVIVIAVDGDLTVKRLELVGLRAYLRASNPAYRPIPLEECESHVWGVATYVLQVLYRYGGIGGLQQLLCLL
ncbi:S24 family peptidase [Halomonas sp. TBZ9]|uniref:S24 family peptidase n=1 Tax=Vreelandella azerica TaxID=2732867 RepID=A0A7Y3XBQ1_9GAMM|nr:S24 family peptidase [Halomonas azerica]NOG32475.1 S24 family peptidase [Halomonas azerica]